MEKPEEAPRAAGRKKRTYHSPRRMEQAAVTKSRIVDAAMKLVREKGYADMTLEAIAAEAGVAPQTVYAVCGSKKGVLAAILETTVEAKRYDTIRDSIPKLKGRDRVREIGHFYSVLMENALPVFDIMRGMSMLSPEFAEQEYDQGMMLLDKCRKSVHIMAQDGMLRPGLSEERAAQLYWAITTPGMHRRLTKLLGWSAEEYAAWISYLVGVILLDLDTPLPFLGEDGAPEK
ncbi:MAG: TetR/AcrR family transcriptional regulator [Mailhella sp.]|nr:TetR/AcrR family transcriptional regulator [Mailhella sp.]